MENPPSIAIVTYAFASIAASRNERPQANCAAIADASVQPEPCVLWV